MSPEAHRLLNDVVLAEHAGVAHRAQRRAEACNAFAAHITTLERDAQINAEIAMRCEDLQVHLDIAQAKIATLESRVQELEARGDLVIDGVIIASDAMLKENRELRATLESYRAALERLDDHASNHVSPYWISVPSDVWKEVYKSIDTARQESQ